MGYDDEDYNVLMQSYFLYSSLLALKLLAFSPLAAIMCNPEKIRRANISDLKNLTPFWLVSGLYMTTSPSPQAAVALLRLYVLARIITALGYVLKIPTMLIESAFFLSFGITAYMAGFVVYTYKDAL